VFFGPTLNVLSVINRRLGCQTSNEKSVFIIVNTRCNLYSGIIGFALSRSVHYCMHNGANMFTGNVIM